MNKKWQRLLWVAGVAGSLGLCGMAGAQSSPFQPFKSLFGPKTTAPEKAAEQKAAEANRVTEIQVEMAWLSDRMTFPYYLEAHVKGSNLEVRGYVPTKAIRDQALNLAKLNCSLTVTDAMKEHSSLAFRSVPRPPEQLKSSVVSSLREDFPGLKLTIQCQTDGNVQIAGNVKTLEQKLAISKALRRLYGCTYVTNNTLAANGDLRQPPVLVAKSTPNVMPPSTSSTMAPTRSTPSEPYESHGVVVVSGQEPAKTGATPSIASTGSYVPVTAPSPLVSTPKAAALPATPASAALIKRKIETAVANIHGVAVTFTSKNDVKVECTLRTGEDFDTVAGQIHSIRELEPYQVDLRITLPMADHK
jgi:hypothetical protein